MQSRHSRKKGAKAEKIDEQQYEINPRSVFVNSASSDSYLCGGEDRANYQPASGTLIRARILLLHRKIGEVDIIV